MWGTVADLVRTVGAVFRWGNYLRCAALIGVVGYGVMIGGAEVARDPFDPRDEVDVRLVGGGILTGWFDEHTARIRWLTKSGGTASMALQRSRIVSVHPTNRARDAIDAAQQQEAAAQHTADRSAFERTLREQQDDRSRADREIRDQAYHEQRAREAAAQRAIDQANRRILAAVLAADGVTRDPESTTVAALEAEVLQRQRQREALVPARQATATVERPSSVSQPGSTSTTGDAEPSALHRSPGLQVDGPTPLPQPLATMHPLHPADSGTTDGQVIGWIVVLLAATTGAWFWVRRMHAQPQVRRRHARTAVVPPLVSPSIPPPTPSGCNHPQTTSSKPTRPPVEISAAPLPPTESIDQYWARTAPTPHPPAPPTVPSSTVHGLNLTDASLLEFQDHIGTSTDPIPPHITDDGLFLSLDNEPVFMQQETVIVSTTISDAQSVGDEAALDVDWSDLCTTVPKESRVDPNTAAAPRPSPPVGVSAKAATSAARINWERVSAIEGETAAVHATLAHEFSVTLERDDIDDPASSKPPAVMDIMSTSTFNPFPGLESRVSLILSAITAESSMPASAFANLCRSIGIMPGVARDIINTWAEDHVGDIIITGDDPCQIDGEAIRQWVMQQAVPPIS